MGTEDTLYWMGFPIPHGNASRIRCGLRQINWSLVFSLGSHGVEISIQGVWVSYKLDLTIRGLGNSLVSFVCLGLNNKIERLR